MEYTLLSGADVGNRLDFLNKDIVEKLKEGQAWAIVGHNESHDIQTVGIFSFDPTKKDTLDLSFIYTVPEEREDGWAMGLIYYACKAFEGQGIKYICCCPFGTESETEDITIFLQMAGFEQASLDWHMYTYQLSTLRESIIMRPFLGFEGKGFLKLSRDEIRYYLNSMDNKPPTQIRDNMLRDCDAGKSVFAIMVGKIVGAILVMDEKGDEVSILNLYVDQSWGKKQNILMMLGQAIKGMPDTVDKVNFAVENQRVMDLYRYIFGEPKEDCLIQYFLYDIEKNRELRVRLGKI